MAARRVIVGALLFAALLPAGCGDSRSAAEKRMDLRFRAIDYRMGNLETLSVSFDPSHLAHATEQYVALVREYAGLLGRDEARHRLLQKGEEVAPFCLPCKQTLQDEAKRY
jgi:hypothetical protein